MNGLPLAYAFGAGLLATINPCGFAMLPSFIAFYLGVKEPNFEKTPVSKRFLQVLRVGGAVTAGFLTVFVIGGFLVSLGLSFVFAWVPYLTIAIGVALVAIGLVLLFGRSVDLKMPQPKWVVRRQGLFPMYLYGVTYAIASLSCTLPVFLVVVGSAAALGGAMGSLAMFIAYGLGMAMVLLGVTLGAALFQGAVARWLRILMPYVKRVSAVLLILVGLYLVVYQLQNSFGIGIGVQSSQVPSLPAIASQQTTPPFGDSGNMGGRIVLSAAVASPAAPSNSGAVATVTTRPVATVTGVPEEALPASAHSINEASGGEDSTSTQEGSITFHVPAIITAPTYNDGCCVWASDMWITDNLQRMNGVKGVTVDTKSAIVRVDYDPKLIQPAGISAELDSIGYPADKAEKQEK